ncbi:MAG TPA: EAL domain-containing protein [Solirubrobacteraceae bacterium]|nr:EAL domain-containing protein [Solirubrobacteraceae bacterium]
MTELLVAELQDYAIVMLDLDGRVASWNAGARDITGYEAQEILGRRFSVFYSAQAIADRTPELLLATARAQGRVEQEGWRVRKDGSLFWANVVITAIHDAHGILCGYGKVTRDLTERHAVELARHAAEERFRAAFTHAPVGIAITGLEGAAYGRLLEANPAITRMLGYGPDELIGRTLSSITFSEDREATVRALQELSVGASISIELRLAHRDGRAVWVLLSSTPLPDPARASLRCAITQVLDISERKRFETHLRHLADHDALTGLLNRHRFESELARVTAEVARYRRRASLLVLDLDGFKDVNDRFGHPVGDELITRIGALLRDTLRTTDVVARLGGDEFIAILPEAGPADAKRLANRILEAVRDCGQIAVGDEHAQITASIGLTSFDGDTGLTGAELVAEADVALYEAKAEGRNRRVLYDRSRPRREPGAGGRSWTERLRDAVQRDRFVLHAQPIRGICAEETARYELLLRLRDADGQLIPPGAFLESAERFDLMGEIDRWVLRRALELLEAHERAGHDISLSVNLSGRTMNDPDLTQELAALLTTHPIAPGRLILEVTETAAIVNIDRARELAANLRALGCRFALDDFGSGFASFSYLKHLDFDYLKIDGEFIRHLSRTPTDQVVVRAVVDIARGLETRTVAEFVGDDPTVELLRALGIDYGQGFHLGRPGPLELVLPPLDQPVPA